jgi:hypothetical protein
MPPSLPVLSNSILVAGTGNFVGAGISFCFSWVLLSLEGSFCFSWVLLSLEGSYEVTLGIPNVAVAGSYGLA